ncbi:MAG: SusC/RagA family TonB-linked outer membrane protein [Gemmatimonadota bacterium]|nr:SusC/RagA family TonB-linked outer membrane protein [Gemmatimonadota bacterium]
MRDKLGRHVARGARGPARAAFLIAGAALISLLGVTSARAQGARSGSVTGQVTEATSRQGIVSASVTVLGTQLGAFTDQSGHYRISSVPAGPHTLIIRRIGYVPSRQSVVVEADQTVTLDVVLNASATSLNQVVVTGTAGGQQSREIGNVVSTIAAPDQLSKSQAPNLTNLIAAKAAGVSIVNTSGRLGAAQNIQIRGVSSIGLSNSPLIYVDGVRVNSSTGGGPTGLTYSSQNSAVAGRLNDINPEDIESIQIIKGPAAATIYGTEAANGVIQIITKKGARGKPTFNAQIQDGSIYFRNAEGRIPTNYAPDSTGAVIPYNAVTALNAVNKPLFKTGQARQYSLGLSGGNSSLGYYLSSNYENDLGIEPNNSVRQFSSHGNLNATLTPALDVGTSLNYVQANNHLGDDVGVSGMLGAVLAQPLVFKKPGAYGFYPNVPPAFSQTLYDNSDGLNRFTGSVTINHRPATWLTQRLITGIDYSGEDARDLERFAPADLAPFALSGATGAIYQTLTSSTVATADYSATAKAHVSHAVTSSTSIGGQFYRTETNTSGLGGQGFPGAGITTVSATATALPSSQVQVINTTIGGYGQEELGFNDRLFLTAALRVDNNSAFGADFKLITYPKFSAAWVVNEEPWWHSSFINTFKLRGALGESGRAPAAFTALRTYAPVQGPGGSNAFTAGSFGNSDLKPERGKELELGFDSQIADRLTLNFTYYNKHTTDEIVAQSVAPSSGFFGTQYKNLGQVNDHGVELQADVQILRGEKLAWDISGNFSTAQNQIVSLGGVPSLVTAAGQANVVGNPISGWYSRRFASATQDPTTGKVTAVLCDGGTGNAAVACSAAPFEYVGSPIPTRMGSIGNTVTLWGRLRLYALVDWKGGYKVYNVNELLRCSGALGAGLCDVNYNPKNYSAARVAEANVGVSLGQNVQDQYLQDGSFVKLRELSGTYTLPDNFFPGVRHSSFTLAGRELGLWTSYRGPDPEVSRNNVSSLGNSDQGLIPPLSRITATLNLTF